jgi:hypothetical protein
MYMEKGIYISLVFVVLLAMLGVIISFLISIFLVPFIPTPKRVRDEILKAMKLKKGEILIDLGSGDGRFLIDACNTYEVTGIGYEISPLSLVLSHIYKAGRAKSKKNLTIISDNFSNADISTADKIYCYLNPKGVKALRRKLKKDTKEDAIIYSYEFPFPEVKYTSKKTLENGKELFEYSAKDFQV